MCTRYFVEPNIEEIQEVIAEIQKKLREKEDSQHRLDLGEIRPTSICPAIATSRAGKQTAFPMQWGFTTRRPDVVNGRRRENGIVLNARTETAAKKPMFSDSWRNHRCILPASWYYEWEHLTGENGKTVTGDRYSIKPKNETVTWLCGLYRIEDGFPHFVVLTREPSKELAKIHDRMPLMLPAERVEDWVNPESDPDGLIQYALTEVVCWR